MVRLESKSAKGLSADLEPSFLPILLGNRDSLSMLLWHQAIRCSMYSGAGILVGFLYVSESCQRYSNLNRSALVCWVMVE